MSAMLRLIGDSALVYKRFQGAVTLEDTTGVTSALATLPGYRTGTPQFVDLSQVTEFAVPKQELLSIARMLNRMNSSPLRMPKVGLYAPTSEQFAAALPFAEMVNHEPGTARAMAMQAAVDVLLWLDQPETILEELNLRSPALMS